MAIIVAKVVVGIQRRNITTVKVIRLLIVGFVGVGIEIVCQIIIVWSQESGTKIIIENFNNNKRFNYKINFTCTVDCYRVEFLYDTMGYCLQGEIIVYKCSKPGLQHSWKDTMSLNTLTKKSPYLVLAWLNSSLYKFFIM